MKIVTDNVNGCEYFTAGKKYVVLLDYGNGAYDILSDRGIRTTVFSKNCPHVHSNWRIAEYDEVLAADEISRIGQEIQPEDYIVTPEEEEQFKRMKETQQITETSPLESQLTGGSVDYYKALVENPTSGSEPYTIEVNDFIEAFELNFAEGNIVKAIVRLAQLRRDSGKPGSFARYEAEKQKFFADRVYEKYCR